MLLEALPVWSEGIFKMWYNWKTKYIFCVG